MAERSEAQKWADALWGALEGLGKVDELGGAEYRRTFGDEAADTLADGEPEEHRAPEVVSLEEVKQQMIRDGEGPGSPAWRAAYEEEYGDGPEEGEA
jgi:hypothetical protein